jgi:hypothetical protein
MRKLVWPLRHAKAAYAVGNYLATISLAGIVAEMVAVLIFDVAIRITHASLLSEEAQRTKFGRKFELLDQKRRVRNLRDLKLINDEEAKAFDSIRLTRRKHLHLWLEDGDVQIANEAVEMYKNAVFLVVKALGLGISGGAITLKAEILEYLKL